MRVPRWVAVLSFILGLGFLLAAWVFGNPPGAAPDEPSHYVRAVGAASGDVLGEPGGYGTFARYSPLERKYVYGPEKPLGVYVSINDYSRAYTVPANLYPVSFGCNAFQTAKSAACVNTGTAPAVRERWLSQHAGQNPLPYLLAGPLMILQHSPEAADWAGRSVLALWCVLLVGFPLALGGMLRGQMLLSLVVSITPMAVFTGAILNPSGIEVFSSIGFFLALLALIEGRFPRLALAATAFTGVFVCMSRPFGPLWIAVGLVAAIGLTSWAKAWAAVNRHRVGSAATAFLIGLGALSTLLILHHYPEPTKMKVASLPTGELYDLAQTSVGLFGWLDSPLPLHVAKVWLLVLVGITALALTLGNRRERVTVIATTLLITGLIYYLSKDFLLVEGINPQGRHFLPILVLQPMVTTTVLARRSAKIRIPILGFAVVGMLLLQVIGWLSNGSRQGLGVVVPGLRDLPSVTRRIIDAPAWSPPGGFLVWLVVLLLGCGLLLLAGVQALDVVPTSSPSAIPRDDAQAPTAREGGASDDREPLKPVSDTSEPAPSVESAVSS